MYQQGLIFLPRFNEMKKKQIMIMMEVRTPAWTTMFVNQDPKI